MLFWRVYDQKGNEHILNLEHVQDIVFLEDADDFGERVVVQFSDGLSVSLADNPKRRQLVEGLILDASRIDRKAIQESRKNPVVRMRKEAEEFWAKFPANLHDKGVGIDKPLIVNVKFVPPAWAKKLTRKARRIKWRWAQLRARKG